MPPRHSSTSAVVISSAVEWSNGQQTEQSRAARAAADAVVDMYY